MYCKNNVSTVHECLGTPPNINNMCYSKGYYPPKLVEYYNNIGLKQC